MKHFPMATRYMVILGRTYADGTEEDYEIVNELQAQYKITPLSAWGKPYTPVTPPVNPNPGFSMTDKPQKVILGMGTEGYFNLMAKLMGGVAPPAAEDAPMVASMAKIGIVPGKPFEMSKLDPAVQAALKDIPQTALKKIEANKDSMGEIVNGWIVRRGSVPTARDYLKRATVAAFGWPANQEKDAVYPYTEVDCHRPETDRRKQIHVDLPQGRDAPGQRLLVDHHVHDRQGWWFVPNPLNKFTVSMRDNPKFNADGSLTLYFQNESPGADKEANWLPAPKGDFLPMIRMYWPKDSSPSILNGSWKPPAVVKVELNESHND